MRTLNTKALLPPFPPTPCNVAKVSYCLNITTQSYYLERKKAGSNCFYNNFYCLILRLQLPQLNSVEYIFFLL